MGYGVAEGIKENGNFRYQPLGVAAGYKDVIGHYPPLLYHIVVLFSSISAIEIYDSLILMIIFLLSILSLTSYIILRKFNKNVAILALPLMLLIFYNKFSSAITWGQHGLITGGFFLIAAIWSIVRFDFNELFFIILFLSASFYSHQPEFIFILLFIFIYLLLKVIYREFKLDYLKKLVITGVITFIIISYFLLITINTWGSAGFSKLDFVTVEKFLEGRAFPPILLLKDFNVIVVVLVFIGLVISLLMLLKKNQPALTASIFLFLLGLSNYTGFGHKAFQQRFFWPIYISTFFGLGIYYITRYIAKFFMKKWKINYSAILSFFVIIIFIFIYSGKTSTGSLVDNYHWDSFSWIRSNTDKEEPIYFFFQDLVFQPAVYYSSAQRKSYFININEFMKVLQNATIKRNYHFRIAAEGGAGLPYRKSFFNYGKHIQELVAGIEKPKDICSMKYIVFDKVSRQQPLANYNILIMNQIIKNDWIEEVYSNPVVSILKNNKPGEDCIVEQRISE